MYQKLVVVGNLGRDPEMRYAPNGTAVTNLSVATSRKWTSADGEPQEETAWFKVAVWGKHAESCNQYLSKGSQVLVEGTMTPNEFGNPRIWETRDGKAAASYEVRAQTVKFLNSRGAVTTDQETAPTAQQAQEEDDIPF